MFDPALKALHDNYPNFYVDLLCQLAGLPTGQAVEVVQPNVPPRTLDVDRAYRLTRPGPMILHVEFESGHPPWRPDRFLVYNVLLSRQEGCPVKTVVVLLRPDADSPTLTGRHRVTLPTGEVVHEFAYAVVRLWELPTEMFLNHSATMPLAVLTNVPDDLVAALADRIVASYLDLPESERHELASNSVILAGLRFPPAVARQLFQKAGQMRESSVYQEILREGRVEGRVTGHMEGLIDGLVKFAKKRLGAPDATTLAAVQTVSDEARIDRLYDRVDVVKSWAELLQE